MSGVGFLGTQEDLDRRSIQFDKMIEDNASLKMISRELKVNNIHLQFLTEEDLTPDILGEALY
jgi:hypothetical protein